MLFDPEDIAVLASPSRITTPMMFLLGLIFLFPLLVHGPAADEWLPVKIEKCYRNWWAIPLHFNNWLTHKDICAGHLWYLACDMQIFTVVALLCVLLAKNVRVGFFAMVAIAVSCNIFIAYFTYSAQIGPSRVSSGGDVTKMMQALDLIHQRPYPHVASYVTGVLVGFVFLKYRHVRLRQVTRLGLWLCSTVFCLYGVFGAFKWQKGAPPTGVDVALFNGVHRTAFAMGVAWVLYSCASGQAKLIDRFLAWDGFVLLGRLTFSVYLVHFLVLVTSAGMARERIYMAHWFLVRGFLGNVMLSYFLGFLFYLVCEKPFVNLERMLFDKVTKGKLPFKDQDSHKSAGYPGK